MEAIEEVQRRRAEIVDVSLYIHRNPELAFEEHKAAERLAEWLAANGFEVERGIANLPTAFRAICNGQSGGPTIALVAEYDALAQLGHACGHNIIGTASAAAAIAMTVVLGRLSGRMVVLGTPAEEGGGGKVVLVERDALDGVDVAMMVHPGTRTRVVARALACVTLEVEFSGKAAHAAARPEEGINALDALILSYNNINSLRQHLRSDARIHGIITNGGEAPNIIPARASGRFLVRAEDDAYLDGLVEKVLGCFRAGAAATGATFSYDLADRRYSPMRSNSVLEEAFAANLQTIGVTVHPADRNRGFGSTDMGNVSQVVPSIHPTIAIAPESVTTHSPEFAAAAASTAGQEALIAAAKALAMTAVDLLSDAQLLARVKEEFARGAAVN
ncbi:MAG: M20 family metallopeptidase [Chloroflexi bacterium]|nr:M20 family metallopeptidase [Chloroflexota bacterium]